MDTKKIIKKISICLYGFLKKDCSGKVIYYHDVSKRYTNQGTPMDLFVEQIDTLKKSGFNLVAGIPQNNREVMICFDDGWRGIWDHRHFFYDNKIYPTVFLIINFIGNEGYLTKEEIIELQSAGFRFQCHTYSHKNVTEVTGSELYYELIDSREQLSKILGKEVDEFCFPRGEYSDSLIDLALSNGYKRVYICTPGCVSPNDTIINRNLTQDGSIREFKAILHGGLNLFSKRAEVLHHK